MGIDLSLISLEIATAAVGLALLILGLIVPHYSRSGFGPITALCLIGLLVFSFTMWNHQGTVYHGLYIVDRFSIFFKQIFLAAAILVTVGSTHYVNRMGSRSEYYSMLVFATLGMMVLASAGDFITLFIGLELMTIAFVIMVSFRREEYKSVEAGIKYFILAALASAVLLYGLSLVYGLTGTIEIMALTKALQLPGAWQPALVWGMILLLAGLGFKISLVPFHMWAPDIYEGAPTPVTAFLAVGSKAASFAVLLRVFAAALAGVWEQWHLLMAILAALTIVIGNLVAIPQTNIKRMLAYSSIAQAGYILVGLVTASPAGVKGVMFYALLYVFATVGAFTVAGYFYTVTGSDEIEDYAGLSQRSPLMAAVLVISMLSMAGIPPLAGFAGKFYLFMTVVNDYMWLVLIGLVMSMVSVYYYLRVTLVMYRDEPKEHTPVNLPRSVSITLILVMALTLAIGIAPWPVAKLANEAAQSFFLLH